MYWGYWNSEYVQFHGLYCVCVREWEKHSSPSTIPNSIFPSFISFVWWHGKLYIWINESNGVLYFICHINIVAKSPSAPWPLLDVAAISWQIGIAAYWALTPIENRQQQPYLFLVLNWLQSNRFILQNSSMHVIFHVPKIASMIHYLLWQEL